MDNLIRHIYSFYSLYDLHITVALDIMHKNALSCVCPELPS